MARWAGQKKVLGYSPHQVASSMSKIFTLGIAMILVLEISLVTAIHSHSSLKEQSQREAILSLMLIPYYYIYISLNILSSLRQYHLLQLGGKVKMDKLKDKV